MIRDELGQDEEGRDVHGEDVDVGGREDGVGQERGDEMPRVEREHTREEVDAVGGEDRDDHLGVDGLASVRCSLDRTEDRGCESREGMVSKGARDPGEAAWEGRHSPTSMYMVRTEKPQMAIMYFHLDLLVKSGSSSQNRCLREVEGTMRRTPWVGCPSRRGSKRRASRCRGTSRSK